MMRLVIMESPCRADDDFTSARHEFYAVECLRDCIRRGESPYASHALLAFSGALDDASPDEREKGIAAGFAWHAVAHATVVYTDRGISPGMQRGIDNALRLGLPVEYRTLPGWKQ